MKFADRKTVIRLAIDFAVLAMILWAIGRYCCRCPAAARAVLVPARVNATDLRAHVEALAGQLGEHNVSHPRQLELAAAYIEQQWRAQGYAVVRQTYRASGVDCANLEVTIPGKSKSNEFIVVGAHYDSVEGAPGANDNGSGVAAMLEISKRLATIPSDRTVRFVAFVNEEPPYFETDLMGSRVYAKACRQRGVDIRAMLSLETLGCYSDVPGSQHFPSPLFKRFFPTRGNFVAFVSNFRSRPVLHKAVAAFRGNSNFPVQCLAWYYRFAGVNLSDHASFWREGYRAVMVTDTAPFRYLHYHAASDTPDKIDYNSLARVTEGLSGTVAALATE